MVIVLLGDFGAELLRAGWFCTTGNMYSIPKNPLNYCLVIQSFGVMVALLVDSTEKVDALYKKAIELGGSDEGPPGARGEGVYAGYFRDPDGNKLNFFCIP